MLRRLKRGITIRAIKRWGTARAKGALWDKEFATGQWNYLENTSTDPVYSYIERYAQNGRILDLGCGSGNTSNELNFASYLSYTGVDISTVAVEKARARCRDNRRQGKNSYVRSEIETYVPSGSYQLILFRESLFYVPLAQIKEVLDRYASYLTAEGVIIVRMCDRQKYAPIANIITNSFCLVDHHSSCDCSDVIFVFQPMRQGRGR